MSLKDAVIACTPLTGSPVANIGLDGGEEMVGTVVSFSVMSAREMRTAAASAPATFWQATSAVGAQDT